ncbi:MAG: hypothetical protein ACK5NB_02130 [Flavobacteriaceae bacterium]
MIDIKKLEEKDVVFLNKKPTKEEDLAFSKFLKERKSKKTRFKKPTEKQKV